MKRLLVIAVLLVFTFSCNVYVTADADTVDKIQISTVVVSVGENTKTVEVDVYGNYANLTAYFNDTAITDYTDNSFKYTFEADQKLNIRITGNDSNGGLLTSDVVGCNLSRYTQTGKKYAQYINTTLGDANIDGATDIKDLVHVKRIISGVIPLVTFADFGGDGTVTTLDLVALAKLLVSKKAGIALHTVIYAEESGAVMQTVFVPYGFSAKPTVSTKKDGYTFKGWSSTAKNVTEDIIIYANYEADDIYTEWPEGFV